MHIKYIKSNILREKSFDFAVKALAVSKELNNNKEYILSRQFARSSTAIGALLWEAEHAESKADFIHKLSISLKESNETEFWVELMHKTSYISNEKYVDLRSDIGEINRILIASLRTLKANKNQQQKS